MILNNHNASFQVSFVFLMCAIVATLIVKKLLKESYYYKRNIIYIAIAIMFLSLSITYLLYGIGVFTVTYDVPAIPSVHFNIQGINNSSAAVVAANLYAVKDTDLRLFFAFVKLNTVITAVLLAILCFSVSISNMALIRHEGFAMRNVVGAGLELIFVLATAGIYYIDELIISPLSTSTTDYFIIDRCIKLLGFSYLLIYYLNMVLLGIFVMGYLAARQHPHYDKDFIIIPGCSIRKDGSLLPLLKGRTNKAIKYAWEQEIQCGKSVHYVPSGGQGPDEIMSEGSAMELYLLAHAAETYEVFPEKKSRNTYENFLYSKKIIEKINPDAKVAFSTTNYHVLRCGLLAHSVGMNIEGIASSTKWYFWPNGFAREVIAIFVMTKKLHIYAGLIIALICELLV